MTWLGLLVLVIVASLVAFLVRRAPKEIIDEPYKGWLLWLVLVIVVIIIIVSFFGGSDVLNRHIPGTR